MSDVEKKIVFSGEDRLTEVYAKMQQSSAAWVASEIKRGKELGLSSQEVISAMEKEIFLSERQLQIKKALRNETIANIKSEYSKKRESLEDEYDPHRHVLQNRDKFSKEEIYQASQGQRKYFQGKEALDAGEKAALKKVDEDLKFQRQVLMMNKEQKDVIVSAMKRLVEVTDYREKKNLINDAKQIAKETAQGKTDEQIKNEFITQGAAEKISPKEKSKFGEQFAAMFSAQTLANTMEGFGHRVAGVAQGVLGAETGEESATDVLKLIPYGVGDASSTAIKRHWAARNKWQTTALPVSAMTGETADGNAWLGYSGFESNRVAMDIIKSSGIGRDIARRTSDVLKFSRAYGLSTKEAGTLESYQSFTSNREGALVDAGTLIRSMNSVFKSGDFARLPEFINLQSQLIHERSSRFNNINPYAISQGLGAMINVGGMFANKPGEMLGLLDNALKNPSNDYQKALSFQALSKMNPTGSFVDIGEMQEKGIFQKGYMSERMKSIEERHGLGGDSPIIQLMEDMGISSFAQAKQLWKAYQSNPDIFNNITNIDDLYKMGNAIDVSKAGAYTPERAALAARMEDAYAKDIAEGLRETVSQLVDGLGKVMSEITTAITTLGNATSSGTNASKPGWR